MHSNKSKKTKAKTVDVETVGNFLALASKEMDEIERAYVATKTAFRKKVYKWKKPVEQENSRFESRVCKIAIVPSGQPLFSEQATFIEIDDEGAGEFVRVSQCIGNPREGSVAISPDEWAKIGTAIDKMIKECRNQD